MPAFLTWSKSHPLSSTTQGAQSSKAGKDAFPAHCLAPQDVTANPATSRISTTRHRGGGPDESPADKCTHPRSCEELRAPRHLSISEASGPRSSSGKVSSCRPDLKTQTERKAPFGKASPQCQCLGLRYLITSLSYSLIRNFTPFSLSVLVLKRFPEYRLYKMCPPFMPHHQRLAEPSADPCTRTGAAPAATGISCLSSAHSFAGLLLSPSPALPRSDRLRLPRQTLLQTQFNNQPTTRTKQLQHKHMTTCICKLINNENNVAALLLHRLAFLRREGPLSLSPPLSGKLSAWGVFLLSAVPPGPTPIPQQHGGFGTQVTAGSTTWSAFHVNRPLALPQRDQCN